MSDITPDAPATPEAIPAEPEVAPDAAPAAEEGTVDISTLPPEVQKYIHELRDENRDRRKEHEPFKNAFSAYNEAEREYLLNMVTTLAVDQEQGAKVMQELSNQLLGIEQAAQETLDDPVVQEEAAAAGMTKEELVAMVRQEMEQEQMFAAIEAETRSVGFEPGTDEAAKLWDMAVALNEMDLSKVAPLVRQHLGLPEPEGEKNEDVLQAKDINPAPEPDRTVEFPKSGEIPQGSGGTNHEERKPPPPLGSQELNEQVRRRIESMSTPGQ